MMKHSKLPFENKDNYLLDENHDDIGQIWGSNDADFIVTACNSYYPMLEALKMAKGLLDSYSEGKEIERAIKQAEDK